MNEIRGLRSIESCIREAIIAVIGYVNLPAAQWAMSIMDLARSHENAPVSMWYAVAPQGGCLACETFYMVFIFADGSHLLSMHDAASLRTLDPIHRSEGGIE